MSAPRCTTCAEEPVAKALAGDGHDPEVEADVARHFIGVRLTETGPEYRYTCAHGHTFTADFLSPAHNLGTTPVSALSVTSSNPPGPPGEVADIPEVPTPRD
jgi:hypothetical protein